VRVVAVDPGTRQCGVAVFDSGRLLRAALIRAGGRHEGDATADELVHLARLVATWAVERDPDYDWRTDRERDLVPGELVVEQMVSRGSAAQRKGDQNDLIQLTLVSGLIAGILVQRAGARLYRYKPEQWKGTIPKPKRGEEYIVKKRVTSRLDAAELAAIVPCPASLEHNVFDAVGIGLHHTGRSLVDDRRIAIAR